MAEQDRAVIIVGGGIEGLSIARALAARGVGPVTLLERAHLASGMTSKSSGVVRCHYGVESLAAMAWRSVGILEDLGMAAGFRQVGYVVGVGEQNTVALKANVATQQALGIEVELIDHGKAAELWPHAKLDDFAGFAYEPRGGYGDGYQTAQSFASQAKDLGAELRRKTAVESLVHSAGEITGVALADGSVIRAPKVVVAAGMHSSALMQPLGIAVPLRAQLAPIFLVDPGQRTGAIPVLSDLVSLQYVRPDGAGSLLMGGSDHNNPTWVDPDRYPTGPTWAHMSDALSKFEYRFPKLTGASVVSSYTGYYDVTPDYNPVISATPIAGLYLAAGFSGHGYKISPAVGELMADLICCGESQYPGIDHKDFQLQRFVEKRPLLSPHPYVGAGEMR